MKRAALLLGAAAALALLGRRTSSAPAPGARSCPSSGARVLLLGDSLAVGLGGPMAELAAACGTPFVVDAFIGAHVTQWTGARLDAALASSAPNAALISLGGNDFQRTDPEHVRGAIATLVQRLRNAGVRPLWIDPPSFPFEDTAGVRAMWRARVPAADRYSLEGERIERAPDGIHPTGPEYRRLAAVLWAWLSLVV